MLIYSLFCCATHKIITACTQHHLIHGAHNNAAAVSERPRDFINSPALVGFGQSTVGLLWINSLDLDQLRGLKTNVPGTISIGLQILLYSFVIYCESDRTLKSVCIVEIK